LVSRALAKFLFSEVNFPSQNVVATELLSSLNLGFLHTCHCFLFRYAFSRTKYGRDRASFFVEYWLPARLFSLS
jgi:hypothetical protein